VCYFSLNIYFIFIYKASLGDSGAGSVHDFYPLDVQTSNDVQRYASL
jgi:hypothetical protein